MHTQVMKARQVRAVWSLILVLGALAAGSSRAADAKATDPYEVVSTYIRALVETEDGRDQAKKELLKENNSLSAVVRNCARTRLELGARIHSFDGMRLDKPVDWLIPDIVDLYKQQMEVNDLMLDTARVFLEGPKPRVDYGSLAAKMPEIAAKVEYLDKLLFKVTPAVFASLIDERPDKQNHVSHLVITKAQRKELVAIIDRGLGKKLARKDQSWTVSSAAVVRSYLVGSYKSSDDPW